MEKKFYPFQFKSFDRKNEDDDLFEFEIEKNLFLSMCLDNNLLIITLGHTDYNRGRPSIEPAMDKTIFCNLQNERTGNIINVSDSLRVRIVTLTDEELTLAIERKLE
jgi:hypothetical protein